MNTPASPAPPSGNSEVYALSRTLMAAERTLMAWIRTVFAMMSFGFALSKFLEYLHQSRPDAGPPPLFPQVLGLVLVGGASLLSIFAGREFLQVRREILPHLPSEARQYKLAPTVAWLLAALGVVLFVILIVTYGEADLHEPS